MREHRLQRLCIHLGLELMPLFERHGLLRRRPRTDFIDQLLQIRKFLPGAILESSFIDCETVRVYVAQLGAQHAKALARAAGMTASQEWRARRCLETED
jgi:hypothetical protein